MLIRAQHLVDRLRHGSERADALVALRRRMVELGHRFAGEAKLVEAAAELRADRERLASISGESLACHSCARGHPPPAGIYPGGHCCSGHTEELFDDPELLALALVGTRPGALEPAGGPLAGCAFRGSPGCVLPVINRPTRCLAYTCRELEAEISAAGGLAELRRARNTMAVRRSALTEALTEALAATDAPAMQSP